MQGSSGTDKAGKCCWKQSWNILNTYSICVTSWKYLSDFVVQQDGWRSLGKGESRKFIPIHISWLMNCSFNFIVLFWFVYSTIYKNKNLVKRESRNSEASNPFSTTFILFQCSQTMLSYHTGQLKALAKIKIKCSLARECSALHTIILSHMYIVEIS